MDLEWILLAEGIGANASAALTAISINQNIVATPTLPTTTRRVILAHFVGQAAESREIAGKEISVSAQVLSPSGETIFATTGGGKFLPPLWADLPVGLDIAVELPLRLSEYGPYEVKVTARTDDGKMEGHTFLYVVEPQPAT